MVRFTTITIQCKCGQELFHYHKRGTGRLVKCYIDQLEPGSLTVRGLPNNTDVACPKCNKRIGTVQLVRGRPAIKLNQGQIKGIHIG